MFNLVLHTLCNGKSTMKLIFIILISSIMISQAEDDIEEFSTGNSQFTANIFKELSKSNNGNILVCPLSIRIILALVHAGAGGVTAAELANALKLPENAETIREMFSKLYPLLHNGKDYSFINANKVYVKSGFQINDRFIETSTAVFKSEIKNVDFEKTQEAASVMNRWVEGATHGKITDLIQANTLTKLTRVVLINALYFKGSWVSPFFVINTLPRPFHLNNKEHMNVDMMELTEYFNYYESSELGAKFLEMPYTGDGASMIFVLPNDREGLFALENNIANVLDVPKYYRRNVHVQIPKFRVEQTINFEPILTKLGVVEAFQNTANFSGISADTTPLKISNVVQKTFIKVDEKGTVAAAASGISLIVPISLPPPPEQFIANHPFLYFIKLKGIVVFIGRYSTPEI